MNKQKNVMAASIGALLVAIVLFGGATTQARAEYIGNDQTVQVDWNKTSIIQISGSAPVEFHYRIVQTAQHGNIEYNGATGDVSYTPNANFTGQDSFTFDTVANMANWFGDHTGTVTINVVDPPIVPPVVIVTPPSSQPMMIGGGHGYVWKMFYEPIDKALKNLNGTQVGTSAPINQFGLPMRSYIEFVHMKELINSPQYGFQNLTEGQQAWLFLKIKPEIDGAFQQFNDGE